MSVLCDCHMGVKCFESTPTGSRLVLPEPAVFRIQRGLWAQILSCTSNLRSCPNLSPSARCFRSLRRRKSDLAGQGPSPAPTVPFLCAKRGRTGCLRTIPAGESQRWAVHKLPSLSVEHPQPRVAQGQLRCSLMEPQGQAANAAKQKKY